MSAGLLVRNAAQLLTLKGPELEIVENGSALILNGRFAPVSAAAGLDVEEFDARGKIVLPGFVDSHTHLVWARPRLLDYEMRIAGATYEDIAARGGGILSTVKATREASEAELLARARTTLAAFFASGTTTVEAKSGYGLDRDTELKTLRVYASLAQEGFDVIPTYLGAHVCPPEFAGANDYVQWLASEMLPQISGRAAFADVFCEQGAFTLEQSSIYLEAARRHGLGLKLHAEQFSSSGAARLGVELGAASVDHLECRHRSRRARAGRIVDRCDAASGSGFPSRVEPLPARPDAARSRRYRRAGDRLQSRDQPDRQHAHDPFARLHANAHDPGGGDSRRHHQRRARPSGRASRRLDRAGQRRQSRRLRRRRLSRDPLLFRHEPGRRDHP